VMGQLRTALRAFAMQGHEPAEVLAWLNSAVSALGHDEFATAVYLTLDPVSGTLTYCSAGHPPLLVAPAGGADAESDVPAKTDGGVLLLTGDDNLPLGVLPDFRYRQSQLHL